VGFTRDGPLVIDSNDDRWDENDVLLRWTSGRRVIHRVQKIDP